MRTSCFEKSALASPPGLSYQWAVNAKFLLPISVLSLTLTLSLPAQDVQTRLGDVKDSRTTGQFFAGLEVELKLSGDGLADAKSMRVAVQTATDDTGRNLIDPEKMSDRFESIDSAGSRNLLTLKLKNPARKAVTVKEITGTLELLVPKLDPESTVAIEDFQQKTGAPFDVPALQRTKVSVIAWNKAQYEAARAAKKAADAKKPQGLGEALGSAFGEMFGFGHLEENGIAIQVDDPDAKFVELEFQDAGGKKLESNGRSSTKSNKVTTMFYDFSHQLPENAKLVIYLSTPKALVKVPVELKDVPLP